MYYRAQSNKYEVNENSQSYTWECEDILDGMLQDLKKWEVETDIDFESRFEREEELRQLWDNNWRMAYDAEPANKVELGLSCFEDPKELYDYFVNSEHSTYGFNFHCYILVFDGEYVSEGGDGEKIVIFEKEINRMSIDEFRKQFED